MPEEIPVIDLFAGPGGLGEGFDSFRLNRDERKFRVRLSIENDPAAHRTLMLRSFFRQFERDEVPDEYYDYLKGEEGLTFEKLPRKWREQGRRAREQAWRMTLSGRNHKAVRQRIERVLDGEKWWALIGGPPCQAYSVAGRVRMKHFSAERQARDRRHVLYKEYLRILADHRPPVFVMENVPGLLSSTFRGKRIFEQMRLDLERPAASLRRNRTKDLSGLPDAEYEIHSLIRSVRHLLGVTGPKLPSEFVVRAEEYGIPQARHRVFLLGVRTDLMGRGVKVGSLEGYRDKTSLAEAIGDLPRLRPTVTRKKDPGYQQDDWVRVIKENLAEGQLLRASSIPPAVAGRMLDRSKELDDTLPIGGRFVETQGRPSYRDRWYVNPRLRGVCNHESRRHMWEDLCRYFFASCFTEVEGRFPRIADFPEKLRPNHRNVEAAVSKGVFADRFCVQLPDAPSRTVTCHLSKDGHYFIHYDPTQCRSLTVREAARIQTFPDDYFFEGTRTQQYQQVGNAVPPLLAQQIAEVVYDVIEQARNR